MIFNKTKLEGVFEINLETNEDNRGFFSRNFCKKEFQKNGIDFDLKQINLSLTKHKGTLRGLHYQKSPRSEDKLVQCLTGEIYDVVLDLRSNSKTYKKWQAFNLKSTERNMVLIPSGCAHGFQSLTDNCLIQYMVSDYYSSEHDAGIRWNDPKFNIEWPIKNPKMSERDKNFLLK